MSLLDDERSRLGQAWRVFSLASWLTLLSFCHHRRYSRSKGCRSSELRRWRKGKMPGASHDHVNMWRLLTTITNHHRRHFPPPPTELYYFFYWTCGLSECFSSVDYTDDTLRLAVHTCDVLGRLSPVDYPCDPQRPRPIVPHLQMNA